jgi:hypothetical protein
MTALDESTETRLAVLAARATHYRPRLFAVHGLRNSAEDRPILGWGMEFERANQALFYLPAGCVTHHTTSAEAIATRYSRLGDMHLTWFDSEPTEDE